MLKVFACIALIFGLVACDDDGQPAPPDSGNGSGSQTESDGGGIALPE